MLARVATDVVAAGPDYCIVFGGANDIYQDETEASIKSNLTGIVDALNEAGITPIVATILPQGNLSAGQATTLGNVNDWIRANYEGWGAYLCDWTEIMSDSGVDDPVASYFDADLIHPNSTGAQVMASVLDDVLAFRLAGY